MDREKFKKKYLKDEDKVLQFYMDLDEVIRGEKNPLDLTDLKAMYERMYREATDGGHIQAANMIVAFVKTIEVYRMDRLMSKEEPPMLMDFVKWAKEYPAGLLVQTMCEMENWDLKEFKKKKSLRLTLNNWMRRNNSRNYRGYNSTPMLEV
jgi:hypothetical protein